MRRLKPQLRRRGRVRSGGFAPQYPRRPSSPPPRDKQFCRFVRLPSLPPGRRHATPAARRSTAPFTWASIAPFAVPPHVTRASPLAPHCHQSAVASWHWATPRHARLATPRRIICHTQVNLTECRPSRPCDGERDREHKISAASSGDAFVQHSILAGTISAASSGTLVFHQRERNISAASSGDACSTFHEPVLRRFALSVTTTYPYDDRSSSWVAGVLSCAKCLFRHGRLAGFDGSCAKCLFKGIDRLTNWVYCSHGAALLFSRTLLYSLRQCCHCTSTIGICTSLNCITSTN